MMLNYRAAVVATTQLKVIVMRWPNPMSNVSSCVPFGTIVFPMLAQYLLACSVARICGGVQFPHVSLAAPPAQSSLLTGG
jgi:hypothetical protein